MTIKRAILYLLYILSLGLAAGVASPPAFAALTMADRVKETTTTAGTGTVSLAGAATGYRTFVAGIGTGNTCHYVLIDGSAWEVGLGTVTDATPDTLSRDTVISSSAGGGSRITLSGGTVSVINTLPGSASDIRSVLALVPGTNVQAWDADLDDLADGSLSGSKVGTGIDGANVSTGTVADGQIASTITRDSEAAAAYQPIDADLTDLADQSYSGTWSSLGTVTTIDINGGSIDGTAIGAASRSSALFTTLGANGNTTLGDSASSDTLTIAADTNTATGAGADMYFGTGASPIATADRLDGTDNITPAYQWASEDVLDALLITASTTDTVRSELILGKQPNSTLVKSAGGVSALANNEDLGCLGWIGGDGTDMEPLASICGYADAAAAANDTPGRISFSTTPDGSAVLAEAMRIENDKDVIFYGTASIDDEIAITANGQCSATITADAGAALSVAGCSMYLINSDNATSTSRTFCLAAGVDGQILTLIHVAGATNEAELGDGAAGACSGSTGAAAALAGVWPAATSQQNDTAVLVYLTAKGSNGAGWFELDRSAN